MTTLLHDERIPAALLAIVMHITVVSAVAMVAASLARRNAAFRHSILWTAMFCPLASPLFYAFGAWSGLSIEIQWLCCCKTSVDHSSGGIRSSWRSSKRSIKHAKSSVIILYCRRPSRRPTDIRSSAWPSCSEEPRLP